MPNPPFVPDGVGDVPATGQPLEPNDAVAVASMLDILQAAVREQVLGPLVIANMKRRLVWAGVVAEGSGDEALAAGLEQVRSRVRLAHRSYDPLGAARLSYGAESILAIGENSVEYLDDDGQQRIIDLTAHVRRERYVADRHMMSPAYFVEFRGDPPVRFEFANREEAYDKLIGPLGSVGWSTFDLT